MFRKFLLLGLVISSTAGHLSAQPNQGRTFAFLVACGDYDKTQLRPVPFTVGEMKLFRDVLITSGVADNNIVFLHDDAKPVRFLPTRTNILDEFKLLMERLRPGDAVIVALSGHGVQFKDDPFGYFCPLDAKIGLDTKNTLLPMEGDEGLLKLLDSGKAGRKLLIVNACRNNPTSNLNLAAQKLQLRDEYNEEAPQGTVMLLACKQNQFSWFYPETEKREGRRNRSLFMYHLTEAWKGSYASGKKVTVDHVIQEVTDRVEADAVADFKCNQIPIVKRKFDGAWELGGAAPSDVRLYDLTGGYRFCHFSPDNTVRALVGGRGKPQRWVMDVRTGATIAGPLAHQDFEFIDHAEFSVDGTRVVTVFRDNSAVVWDARTGKRIAGPLTHQGEVNRAEFSMDGTRIVTASVDKTAVVWDARTGAKVTGPLKHQGKVWWAAFSVDGTRVVTCAFNETVVWDARTGERIAGLKDRRVHCHAAFSVDGTRVVTSLATLARRWSGTPAPARELPDPLPILGLVEPRSAWMARAC